MTTESRINRLEKQVQMLILERKLPNWNTYTAEEVAEAAGLSPRKIKELEKQGHIIPAYPRAKRRYKREDVNQFLKGFAPKRRRKVDNNKEDK